MNQRALWKVSVTSSSEAAEAIAEWIELHFAQPAVGYTDAKTGATTISIYLRARPAAWAAQRAALAAALEHFHDCGLPTGPAEISLGRLPAQDWAESWKRHFKPIQIGAALLIKPSWSRRRPRKGQKVIILDPGLSFGTGHHPTTGFCLRQLVAQRRPAEAQSFLDLGTGSGILALAAAQVGYQPVEGLDFDPDAIRIARHNARRNQLAGRIHFLRADVARMASPRRQKFSVICANLLTHLLLTERDRILARLAPGGVLVVAGILRGEFALVRRAYEAAGLELRASRARNEWRSGVFCQPP